MKVEFSRESNSSTTTWLFSRYLAGFLLTPVLAAIPALDLLVLTWIHTLQGLTLFIILKTTRTGQS